MTDLWGRYALLLSLHIHEIMNKESPSELGPKVNKRSVVFHDPNRVVDHVFDDLGGEGLVYLGGDATNELWSGTERSSLTGTIPRSRRASVPA